MHGLFAIWYKETEKTIKISISSSVSSCCKLKTIHSLSTAEHIQEHYQSTHEKDNNIMMMMVMMQAFTFSILKQCACIDLCSLFYPGTFYLLPSTLMEGKILSSQFYRQGNWWIKQFIQDLKFKWQNWNLTACGL